MNRGSAQPAPARPFRQRSNEGKDVVDDGVHLLKTVLHPFEALLESRGLGGNGVLAYRAGRLRRRAVALGTRGFLEEPRQRATQGACEDGEAVEVRLPPSRLPLLHRLPGNPNPLAQRFLRQATLDPGLLQPRPKGMLLHVGGMVTPAGSTGT